MEYGSGIAVVDSSNVWTYKIDGVSTGVHPYPFDNGPDYFEEGLARFVKNNKFGFFDTKARIVVPATYDFATPFKEGRAVVCNGCKPYTEGEYILYKGGKWGFIDTAGKVIIPLQYDSAEMFQGGRAVVVLDGKTMTIDTRGVVQK